MKPLLVALVCLSLVGCKKDSPAAPPAAVEQSPAKPEVQPAPAAAEAEAAQAEAPRPEVTEALVAKYVTYLKTDFELTAAALKEINQAGKKLEGKEGLGAAAGALKMAADFNKRREEIDQKARAASGLQQDQVEVLRPVVTDVLTARMLFKRSGATDLSGQLKAALASAPAEQKAQMEEEIKKLEDSINSLRDARDARKEHGEGAVDAVLKHEPELQKVYEALLEQVQPPN